MISANSNTYSYAADAARERFAAYVEGGEGAASVVVLSAEALGETAHAALVASFDRLGYGRDACTFVTTAALPDADLHLLVESLDPEVLVATDVGAASALSRIFRAPLADRRPTRLLGRPTLAFANFSACLDTPEGKRAAWEALKKLAR